MRVEEIQDGLLLVETGRLRQFLDCRRGPAGEMSFEDVT